MDYCDNTDMPQSGFDAGVELACLDSFAFWRYIQTFMLSAQSSLTHGIQSKPTNKIRPDRYTKLRDQNLGYSQRTLYNVLFDGWYDYRYAKVCDIYPPEDYGRMYYNRLPDGTVDKHQRTYEWSGTKYEADSIFVANLAKPSDVGEVSYKHLGGEKFIKQAKDYVFTDDEWEPIYNVLDSFFPPADHEAEYCSGYKLFVRKYDFKEEKEEYVVHDFDFGLSEGSCGFTGYIFSGSSTSNDFTISSDANKFSVNSPILKQHMIDLGINIIISDLGLEMNADGSVEAFGGIYFSQDDILVFRAINNIITFAMPNTITIGSIAFNPDGTIDGEVFANVNKSYSISGQPDPYTIESVRIIADGLSNQLRIEVNDGHGAPSTGYVTLSIT